MRKNIEKQKPKALKGASGFHSEKKHLEAKNLVKFLPNIPGVYLMKDKEGNIIYIGKAKNLKKRISTYFQKNKTASPFTQKLVENIENIEYIETNSELEAIILESNLIKEHQPKYNIVMRDDKSFIYIKITQNEDFPQISIVRYPEVKKDKKAKYFGPKTSVQKTKDTLKILKKIFTYRHCNLGINYIDKGKVEITKKGISYPCIDYHINRCSGPCIGLISKEEYKKIIQKIIDFLEGKHKEILKELKQEMSLSAQNKQFEKAASIRDKISAIESITVKQQISQEGNVNQDVINFTIQNTQIFFNLFIIREGNLIDQENFIFQSAEHVTENEEKIIQTFIEQYYNKASNLPEEIILPKEPEEKEILEKWLKVKIIAPKKGDKHKLLKLSLKNAESFARQSQISWQKDEKLKNELEDLQKLLKIKTKISRIECYDISHINGQHVTGSMTVFENKKPIKGDFRHFKIRNTEGKIDDYKSMEEILSRRLIKITELPPKYKIKKIKKSEYAFIKKIRERTCEKDLKKFYTLKDKEKIIETIGLRKLKGDIFEAFGLWIDKKYRGKKLGQHLMRYILKKCPKNKLYIVCSLNLRNYYEQIGFKEVRNAPENLKKSLIICEKIFNKKGGIFVIEKKILKESFAKKPDLIILDGGKGQLKIGIQLLKKLNLKIPIIAIAKKNEEIFREGSSIPLSIPKSSELSKFFQRIRDEAHRFALNYNKLLREKEFRLRRNT